MYCGDGTYDYDDSGRRYYSNSELVTQCANMYKIAFSILGPKIPEKYNFKDDRLDDRKKTIRALKILRIRQSKFQSLFDSGRKRQVRNSLID